jgi:hypothetical protein
MMIHEEFFGSNGTFFSWRCLICGEVVDQMIIENRDHQSHGGGVGQKRQEIEEIIPKRNKRMSKH